MNQDFNAPAPAVPVVALDVNSRARFIARTYAHLFGAIALFVALEVAIFSTGIAESVLQAFGATSWLVVLGAFMIVSWLASRTAHMARSMTAQYLALAGFVAAEALIFVPLLAFAQLAARGNVIESAAVITLIGFAGLTLVAFGTRRDFSFLRGILLWAGVSAMIGIVASVMFGFVLGTGFSVAMIAFAGAAILYDTSNIIHHYPQDRYVAAALELFASVALMFWYVLRILSSRN